MLKKEVLEILRPSKKIYRCVSVRVNKETYSEMVESAKEMNCCLGEYLRLLHRFAQQGYRRLK